MAPSQTVSALRCLTRLVTATGEEMADGRLLERFARLGDEAAFAALVRRHGPLVLGVCRRVLHNGHDAEDCFQAVFLVLARKAASLTVPRSLGPWLHGVALRTALKARGRATRQRQREEKTARPPAVEQADELVWRDLRPVLDAAVDRLPEKYREPFVLCCLEGATVVEAARRLGCPQGTAAARLARAKERLRAGLTRRGVTLGAVTLGAVLSERMAAPVSAGVVASTVRVAARGMVADGAAMPRAVRVKGVFRFMATNKIRIAAALALLLSAVVGTVVGWPRSAPAEAGTPAPARDPGLQGSKVRFLSLAEAVTLALRQPAARRGASALERERLRNALLLKVEETYWNLYGAYWTLYARELGLRLACESWKITGAKYCAGNTKLANFARTRGQYELFLHQRRAAKQDVLDAEQELRKLLGLGELDATPLVPCDAPSLAPYQPAWEPAVREALARRPEVRLARQELSAAQTGLFLISFLGGADLDPRLRLARAVFALKNEEVKTEQYLTQQWRRLSEFHEQIRAQRAQREAYGLQLRLEFERVGEQITADDTVILEAERFYTDALANEYNAIASYAKVQCAFAFATGTIQEYDRDRFGSGPLTGGSGKQWIEREQRRTRARVAREPALGTEVWLKSGRAPAHSLAALRATAHSLAALWKGVPPLKDVGSLSPDGSREHARRPGLVPYKTAELFPGDSP